MQSPFDLPLVLVCETPVPPKHWMAPNALLQMETTHDLCRQQGRGWQSHSRAIGTSRNAFGWRSRVAHSRERSCDPKKSCGMIHARQSSSIDIKSLVGRTLRQFAHARQRTYRSAPPGSLESYKPDKQSEPTMKHEVHDGDEAQGNLT